MNTEQNTDKLYAMMRVVSWKDLRTNDGIPIGEPIGGMSHFIPVFTSLKEAMEWTKGDTSDLYEIERKANIG